MNIDDSAWNHSTSSSNRDRLFNENVAQRFFVQVLRIAEWQDLILTSILRSTELRSTPERR
jgi:hypothetical protein